MSKFFLYVGCLQTLFATLALAEPGKAQALEQTYVSYDWQNQKLEKAFADIQNQTDFFFTFDRRHIKGISISGFQKQTNLADLLKYISSRTGLRFNISKEIILVKYDTNLNETNWTDPNPNLRIELPAQYAPQLLATATNNKVIYEVSIQKINEDQIVRGRVTSATGEPLIGAAIVVKETGQGTVTDENGEFTVATPDEGGVTLIVSYIGYQTAEIVVNGKTELTIQLQLASTELDEVVVVGYGTQKKINLTGAVTAIDNKQIENRPITQASQALYGISPGVIVNSNTGEAGNDDVTIRIRGVGTLNDANPLILVDGIEAPLNNISPDDIQSINILKDAASAAIYGARAANGVVLITTKRGTFEQKPTVTYNFYAGISAPTVLPDMVTDNRTYLELYREAAINSGRSHKITNEVIERYANLPSTDWLDLYFREDAPISAHNTSLKGGSKNVAYNFSLGYLDQDGIVIEQGFKRYNGRLNLDIKLNEKLKVGSSISFSHEDTQLSPKEEGNTLNFKGYLGFEGAYINHPIAPVFDQFGRYAQMELGLGIEVPRENLIAVIDSRMPFLNKNNFLGNTFVEYEILKGLKIRGTVGANYEQEDFVETRKEITTYDWVTGTPSLILNQDGFNTENHSTSLNITTWIQSTYEKSFGNHALKFLVGANQESSNRDRIVVSESDYATAGSFIALGNGINVSADGNPGEWALRSYFGRVNYAFDDKYLLEFNLRRDGSSRFGANNRWATFPSVSVGWVISQEPFWNSLSKTVDFFKIRASWGQLGNQNTRLYPFASEFSLDRNYVLNNAVVSGGALTRLGNPDLKWEETTISNVGINLGLFNSRVTIEADYFIKETEDILTALPNPSALGIGATSVVNAGSVENKGWEIALNYQDRIGDFSFGIGMNVADIKNKITAINPNLTDNEDILNVGISGADAFYWIRNQPIGAILGYVHDGVFQSQSEIDAAPNHSFIGKPAPGDLRYKDLNGDGVINTSDQTIIGNRQPELNYGFNINLGFKDIIDLSALFQGIGSTDIRLSQYAGPFPFAGLREIWTDRWTPENPSPDRPRIWLDRRGYNGETMLNKPSSFWVEDRAYLRLKNVQVGFNLPKIWISKIAISKARLYLNAQNLLTITDFKDFDPEREVSQRRPTTSLPHAKVFTAGLNVTF